MSDRGLGVKAEEVSQFLKEKDESLPDSLVNLH